MSVISGQEYTDSRKIKKQILMEGKGRTPKSSGHDTLTPDQVTYLISMLRNIQTNVDRALDVLSSANQRDTVIEEALDAVRRTTLKELGDSDSEQQMVEGVFDGCQMIAADGREFTVPPNYASKSKLVEGDLLKLIIDAQGNFVYKQIGPIERERRKAKLDQDAETRQFYAVVGKQRWRLITAAVTFFKGRAGDEVVVLVPKGSRSQWAAVENVIQTG